MGFEGRPQLVARFPGGGGGRSLLLNGHIDAVSAEPLDRWTSSPFKAEVRDGILYGRGSCDMKGGVACMTFAAEVLADLGIRLAGDLIVATNTDEESSGAGGLGLVLRGVEADAGIVTEPTGFDVWISCRGTSYAEVVVPGHPGHAEVYQPHWRDGGAVNAIEKAQIVLDGAQGASRGVGEALRPAPPAAVDARRPADDDQRRRMGSLVPRLLHDHDRGALRPPADRRGRLVVRGRA